VVHGRGDAICIAHYDVIHEIEKNGDQLGA